MKCPKNTFLISFIFTFASLVQNPGTGRCHPAKSTALPVQRGQRPVRYDVNSCSCQKTFKIPKQVKQIEGDIILSYSPLLQKFETISRWIHCAHIACIRNSIRGRSKQFPFIREIEDPTTFRWQGRTIIILRTQFRTKTRSRNKAKIFVRYDGSELLARLTEGHSPETHPHLYTQHCWDVSSIVILLFKWGCGIDSISIQSTWLLVKLQWLGFVVL